MQLINGINGNLRRLAKHYSGVELLDCSSAVLASRPQHAGLRTDRLLLTDSLIPDGVHPSYDGAVGGLMLQQCDRNKTAAVLQNVPVGRYTLMASLLISILRSTINHVTTP
jgi:hypothetical protein